MYKLLFTLVTFLLSTTLCFAIGKSLNNGLALAKIKVLTVKDFPTIKWDDKTIYVLPSIPPTIKPIAGVLTVGSGSMISHVQLLCRALGIPNSNITKNEYEKLKELDGKEVLYVAYGKNEAIVKKTEEISENEQNLIKKYLSGTSFEPITLPSPNLSYTSITNLDDITNTDSGILSGPKAANLGFLKKLFPKRVADGFVLPFGLVNQIFKDQGIHEHIKKLSSLTNQTQILAQLKLIATQIEALTIPYNILSEIQSRSAILLKENNGAGLFIRSDTNVEDLAQFSGAGLNKTIPNVIKIEEIEAAIKSVWASPWSERSHAWRSKYIKNPEAILPSVLIMKSVNAKKAGVMATMNFETGSTDDLFVSSNEGLGFKVVDGLETPEQLLVYNGEGTIEDRTELINMAYAKTQFVLDNEKGGIKEVATTLDEILTANEVSQLEKIVNKIKIETKFKLPFESEFGVTSDGQIQLFQIRPLILSGNENTNAILRKFFQEL
ncbi:MAG: PEP/pyruvate-binding domain-containing protein [Bacteriovoracaceae bacterium]